MECVLCNLFCMVILVSSKLSKQNNKTTTHNGSRQWRAEIIRDLRISKKGHGTPL